jgi:hypothetical protein
MKPQTTATAIDDFEELIQMNITGSTQEELLTRLDKRGIRVSRSTLARGLKLWQEESPSSDSEQLVNLIDYLFHTQPTYSDGLISRRLKEELQCISYSSSYKDDSTQKQLPAAKRQSQS